MAIQLRKGQNINLTKDAPSLVHTLVGLGWDARGTDGARAGGMVARQQSNLKQDGAAALGETSFLTTLLWVLLGLGIGIAVTVVYFINR
ncbi:MAG TPA: TerD family protein, partial [Candidatus Obscuribacter sp.]|nr:TerD family protein [Candidatus Obscuribacter sp.]